MKTQLGRLISGSLSEGLLVRLDCNIDLETIKTGKFVSVVGKSYRFFSLITDLKLEISNPDAMLFVPDGRETVLHEMVRQREMYAVAKIKPMLILNQKNQMEPVKTIPNHFAQVVNVDEQEAALIFGKEDGKSAHFCIGYPLDMQTPVCVDLDRFCERSSGIFGKTGTGKTFITRLLLAGIMRYTKTVCLIFDMHSEYGLQARQEGQNKNFVKGLKTLFPQKTAIFSLDPDSTRRRGGMPDVVLQIPYSAIGVSDILALQSELNLHSTALEAAYLIFTKYKEQWLVKLLEQAGDLKDFASEIGAHPESVSALYRKLKRLERLPFLVAHATSQFTVIDQMMEYIERGISIIIEFGNYTSSFVYLLIANIITKRIHSEYIAKSEQFLGSQRAGDEPNKLIIVIEEAHKFLNPVAAQQTIFGNIAREMRKYYVSLLIVDQRPSGIDDEVLSQIGTKIIAQLNDEKDIAAVLNGSSNATGLRTVLASLDSSQQVMVLGHAIPMPVVIQTRRYDEKLYQSLGCELNSTQIKNAISDLF